MASVTHDVPLIISGWDHAGKAEERADSHPSCYRLTLIHDGSYTSESGQLIGPGCVLLLLPGRRQAWRAAPGTIESTITFPAGKPAEYQPRRLFVGRSAARGTNRGACRYSSFSFDRNLRTVVARPGQSGTRARAVGYCSLRRASRRNGSRRRTPRPTRG